MKSRIFTDNLSRLMSHGDIVGARDLIHAHSPLSNGTYLLRPDGKTLAFSDLAVLMEMKNRNILLPTLGAARRMAPSGQWKRLSSIPDEIRSYQIHVLSRPDDPQPYFLRLKSRVVPGTWLYMAPVMNGPSCFSCHDQKPVLGMVAVTESTASFDSGMQKKRSHLFWGFMGTLETKRKEREKEEPPPCPLRKVRTDVCIWDLPSETPCTRGHSFHDRRARH